VSTPLPTRSESTFGKAAANDEPVAAPHLAARDHAGSRDRAPGVEYDRIIVPVTASPASERAVTTAAMLASEKRGEVTLVNVIEVPKELPLDSLFPAEEHESRTILSHATAALDRYGVRARARTMHATTAATAILDAAEDTHAQLIVIGTERRERRHRMAVGSNVEHVLKRASCRVMIVTLPPR
jgi:nucleotide-binding universal stress UspA family protein